MYALCKRVYGFKGSRQRVYEQMCKLVDDVREGRVDLIPALPV
jgi:hypothetical protein